MSPTGNGILTSHAALAQGLVSTSPNQISWAKSGGCAMAVTVRQSKEKGWGRGKRGSWRHTSEPMMDVDDGRVISWEKNKSWRYAKLMREASGVRGGRG